MTHEDCGNIEIQNNLWYHAYKQQNMAEAIPLVYQNTPEELNKEFVAYVQLFSIDEILEQRMGSLLNS